MKRMWTSEDEGVLRSLRATTKLEIYHLAKQHNLSENQVRELENGGCVFFYSEKIKFQVGKKILNSYGKTTVHSDFSNSDDTSVSDQKATEEVVEISKQAEISIENKRTVAQVIADAIKQKIDLIVLMVGVLMFTYYIAYIFYFSYKSPF